MNQTVIPTTPTFLLEIETRMRGPSYHAFKTFDTLEEGIAYINRHFKDYRRSLEIHGEDHATGRIEMPRTHYYSIRRAEALA